MKSFMVNDDICNMTSCLQPRLPLEASVVRSSCQFYVSSGSLEAYICATHITSNCALTQLVSTDEMHAISLYQLYLLAEVQW